MADHPRTPPYEVRLARAAAIPTLAVAVVAAVAGGAVRGSAGVLGAVIGAAMVMAFFGSGLLVSARTAGVAPAPGMAIAVAAHGAKVLLGGAIFLALRRASWFDADVLALTLVAATTAWLGGQLRGFTRLKLFSVDPVPSVPAVAPLAATHGSAGP